MNPNATKQANPSGIDTWVNHGSDPLRASARVP